jgi:enoyl-CoA hydratase/carnithine racemase
MAELITRREGAVGWIIFSNVAKHNAVTHEMWKAVPEALAGLEREDAVRAIVVTGDGDKAFISGADISQFEKARASKDAQAEYNKAVEAAYLAPARCAKPVIAKIRGICMGGGLGVAAACDLRFASDDATFRMPAARLGLGYNFVGMKRFYDIMGAANTADMFFSARKFDAAEALHMGFVNRVFSAAEFDREVAAYAALVAENAPLTVAAAKRTIAEILKDPQARDLAAVQAMVAKCFASEDYKEGRTAFMEKRKPAFKGR